MEVQFGPNSVDEPSLLYKLQRKIKVFNTCNTLPNRGYNLVTCSSKYGIVFVASPTGELSAYHLKEIIDKECEPKHYSVKLNVEPTHISVNCDHECLAVVGGQTMSLYKVSDFQNQKVLPFATLKFSVSPGSYVSSLQWNPCIPDAIGVVFFDGTLFLCITNTMNMKKLQTNARCLCWSPKGKQIVTGNSDGTLCQYKPDLTPMKSFPAPNLFEGAPVEALSVYWISTFQFAVVFKNAASDSRPVVTIVNTPKGGQPSCYNYEDICYSMGSSRPWFYYLQGIAQWNLILSSSSNSMEIATLGSADGANWLQWCQTDEARPELPLTDKKQENYPVGVAIDICAIHQLPWGENELLPPMPLLHVVSQTGLLSIFNIICLNKAAPQICTPLQPLLLPAAVTTSDIPDDTPPQASAPAQTVLVIPKPQPAIQPQPTIQPLPQSQVPQTSTVVLSQPSTQAMPQQQMSYGFSSATPPAVEHKQADVKPAVTIQPQPQIQLPSVIPSVQPPSQSDEVNEILKAEQEKANKAKMQKELTEILVKEVNDFQMELYKFMLKTRETDNRLQRDMQSISTNNNLLSLDTNKLMKDCEIEELRTSINHLKLDLVRACAVVAEARSHSETKDLPQWAQADPLTTKRVDCVRKLAYYVQNQLEQARKALDLQWNEMKSNDLDNKQGKRMIRPILDDVYQPLVKQQEILMRQEAVLKTMKNTLKECDMGPIFKSTSILRTTPFKKDLSKLTKNIINMKIEANEKSKNTPALSTQKLDALRDMLSNNNPIKVKPVNIELRQQLAAIQRNYKQSLSEKADLSKKELSMQSQSKPMQIKTQAAPQPTTKLTPKPDIVQDSPKFIPSSDKKPIKSSVTNVARTLFTDEPKVEPTIEEKPLKPLARTEPTSAATTITPNTKSLLKDLLQNKSQVQNANNEVKSASNEVKNEHNSFMGQNICSPTSFSFSKPPTAATPSAIFASKSSPNVNVFGSFNQGNVHQEPKPQSVVNEKSSETGELDASAAPIQLPSKPKEDKPMTNLFGMKSSTAQNVPDVLKTNTKAFSFGNTTITPIENTEMSKENIPDRTNEIKVSASERKETKPFTFQYSNKAPASSTSQPVITVDFKKSGDKASSQNSDLSKTAESPSSIFGTANAIASKPLATNIFGSAANVSPSLTITPVTSTSIFGSSLDPKKSTSETKRSTPLSLFSTVVTTTSLLATTSTQGSIFSTSTAQPVVASTTAKPSVFSTPITSEAKTETTQSSTETPQSSAFATTGTSTSIFAVANASAFEAKSTTQASVVTTSNETATAKSGNTSTASSVFGDAATTPQSVFSAAVANTSFEPTSTTQSIFGTTTATTQASVFSATASANEKSIFGAATTKTSVFDSSTPATQASVFGTATQSTSVFGTTTQTSIFGGNSTQASIFGNTTQTTQATPASVFGATTPTTQASLFGTSSTQASVFVTPTSTTQASVFGTPTPTTQTSVFGTPPPATQASVFGTPTSATQPSVFGTPTQVSQASVFGTPTTTAQSASPFGGAETNLFAAASISTTSASNQASGSIFGSSSPGSVFGSSTANVFGSKTTFGQSNANASNIFGGGATFGQKPAPDFWGGGTNTTGGGFGSPGFGQSATTQASSIFGTTTGGSFSTPSTGQPFGSPQQSSVFGTQQQTPSPAFGGSPVFGSKSAFGQSAGFGSPTSESGFGGFGGFNKSPTAGFGGSATFGSGAMFGGAAFGNTSPGKVFGGGSSPSFSTPTQSNATFESLATQNTLTFGNLAQQSGQPQAAAPTSFNASPSFTGWRG